MRRPRKRTQRAPEGEPVEATFLDRHGGRPDAAGTVGRHDAGELIVASWADGIRSQTPLPRDADVERGRVR